MLVQVTITANCSTVQYGNLAPGDTLRCPKEFADHLVKDCGAAKYASEIPQVEKKKKPRK